MKIWVDADACPNTIKEMIYKAAERLKIQTILVANQYVRTPISPYLESVCVEKVFDGADFYIVQNLGAYDLVITADVPLASEVVQKGGVALDPRGTLFDEHSVSDKLSVRNFMQTMRESRQITGGPKPFDNNDKKKFAASFEKQISLLKKRETAHENKDYYFNENGFMVFTKEYHLKRGYCCKNGCKHCPYQNAE